MTDFFQDEPMLADRDPKLLEQFDQDYADPGYLPYGSGYMCERCYSSVPLTEREGHDRYHRALSLRLYFLGSMLRSVAALIPPDMDPT